MYSLGTSTSQGNTGVTPSLTDDLATFQVTAMHAEFM